jgi:exonuclease III
MRMEQDHKTACELGLAGQGDRATRAPTTSLPAAPGPCGPAPCLPRPPQQSESPEYYVVVAGVQMAISNPQFGHGPSNAPTCRDYSSHVWLHGSWRRVYMHPVSYVGVVADGHLGPAPAPTAHTRTARPPTANATAASAAVPAAVPAPLPAAAPAAPAAAPVAPTAAAAADSSSPPAVARQELVSSLLAPSQQAPPPTLHRPARRNYNYGYQVLVWGPRRNQTSLSQVMLTGKDVLERQREELPATLLSGKKRWVGQHGVRCDLSVPVVQQLTKGVVAAIRSALHKKLGWRALFLFEGSVILSTPEAYEALDRNPRRRLLYYTAPVLSNQFAALEPAAEWYQDVMLDGFESDAEVDGSSDCDSEGSELEEVLATAALQPGQAEPEGEQAEPESGDQAADGRQQDRNGTDSEQGGAQQQHGNRTRRHRRNRAPVQPARGLNIGCLNVTGLSKDGKKLLELMELVEESALDVLGITETHELQSKRLPVNYIPGYKYYSKPREGGRGGGVGVAVHECLAHEVKPLVFATQQYEEAYWLVMQRAGQVRKTFLGVVYMPDMTKPAAVRDEAYAQLQQDLLHLSSLGSVVVMGDFNARVGKASDNVAHIGMYGEPNNDINANGQLLLSMLASLDMYSLNARTAPPTPDAHLTYIKRRSATGTIMGQSLIDYIIVTADIAKPATTDNMPVATVGRRLVSTDHMPVLATINRAVLRRHTQTIKLRLNAAPKDFRMPHGEPTPAHEAYLTALAAVGPAYINLLSALQFQLANSQVSTTVAVQQAHETLVSAIRQAADASFGYKRVLVGKSVPWWSQQLSSVIQDRTRAYEDFRASGLAQDWHHYQHLRKKAHQLVAEAKRDFKEQRSRAVTAAFRDRINEDSVLGERDMWQYLRAICPKHVADTAFNAIRHPDGGTATSPPEIAAAFQAHYARLGSHALFGADNPEFDSAHMHDVHCDVQMHLLESHSCDDSSPLDAPISPNEICECLQRLKTNKAGNPAEEGIVNELLKYGDTAMTSMLLQYCNLLWDVEQVHQVPGTIISLPKTGDLSDPTNYRGITLLSVLYKLYTAVLNRRLINFAEGLLGQQDAGQAAPSTAAAVQAVAPAPQQPTAEAPAPQQQAAVALAAQQQQAATAPATQQQSSMTMRGALHLVMAGQLRSADIPTIVPANQRRQNEQAARMARSLERAVAAIRQRQVQLQQQQQQAQSGDGPVPLLHESQNGFRPGRSCVDHQFVLHQLLTGRQSQKKESFVLFVDTYKAFPTVWHDGLFQKLWEKGVRGKMFRVLYNLYQGAKRVVSHDGCTTDAFSSDLGLHEGDVISPTLYLFFIDDLLKEVWEKHPGVALLGPSDSASGKAVAAMQADDFVAVCGSLEEVQAVAATVHNYSKQWRFRLNSKKSAVMHVVPAGVSSNLTDSGIVWNGVPVPVVKQYCYLGLTFQNNCSWNANFAAMMHKVNRRVAMLMPVWKNRYINVQVKRIVMLTCVRPIIEFGAEVWWPSKQQLAKIDRVQTGIIKCAMRVTKEKPCSHAVLAEWGVKPLHMWLHQRAIEYYFRVKGMHTCRLPKQLVDAAWQRTDGSAAALPWQRYVCGLLCKYGIDGPLASSGKSACKAHVKQQQAVCYADMVVRDMSGLSTLQRYVDLIHPSHIDRMQFQKARPYLCCGYPTFGVELMMRVRLGCLCVHERVSRFRRNDDEHQEAEAAAAARCPACNVAVESVGHFLFECPKTADLRSTMLNVLNSCCSAKLQECLAITDLQRKVCSFVSCVLWDKSMRLVAPSIARFLEKAWGVRNQCKYGRSVDGGVDSESAPMGRGADGSIAMA